MDNLELVLTNAQGISEVVQLGFIAPLLAVGGAVALGVGGSVGLALGVFLTLGSTIISTVLAASNRSGLSGDEEPRTFADSLSRPRSQNRIISNPIAYRSDVYGETRLGGTLISQGEGGSITGADPFITSTDTNDQTLPLLLDGADIIKYGVGSYYYGLNWSVTRDARHYELVFDTPVVPYRLTHEEFRRVSPVQLMFFETKPKNFPENRVLLDPSQTAVDLAPRAITQALIYDAPEINASQAASLFFNVDAVGYRTNALYIYSMGTVASYLSDVLALYNPGKDPDAAPVLGDWRSGASLREALQEHPNLYMICFMGHLLPEISLEPLAINVLAGQLVRILDPAISFDLTDQVSQVVAIADHECEQLKTILFNEEVVRERQADGSYVVAPNYPETVFDFSARLRPASGSTSSIWQPTDKVKEIHPRWQTEQLLVKGSYVALTFSRDRAAYRSFPAVSFEIQGNRRCYLPSAQNGGTWIRGYTRNAVSVIITYMIRTMNFKIEDFNHADMRIAYLEANKLIDGEPQFTIDGVIESYEKPIRVLQGFGQAINGYITYTKGQVRIGLGIPKLPVAHITEDIILAQPIVSPYPRRSDRFNIVRPTYPNRDNYYEAAQADNIRNEAAIIEDGEELYQDVAYRFVTEEKTVARLSKHYLARTRQSISVVLLINVAGLNLHVGSMIELTIKYLCYDRKTFSIIELTISPDLTCRLVLQEEGTGTESPYYV